MKCMRQEQGSYKQQQDNSGLAYYHKLTEDTKPKELPKPKPKPKQIKDVSGMYRQYVDKNVKELADKLGVSESSLCLLEAGFNGVAWTVPMFTGSRKMVGVRLVYQNGKKLTMTGTFSGLFYPKYLDNKDLYLCEGPSDTAALMDMGFNAVGRPSCTGGVDYVVELLKKGRRRNVIIISDNDEPKKRPDGTVFYPGQEGAERLFDAIFPFTKSCCIIKPPKHKDIREWYLNGCTKERIECLIKNTRVFYNRK